MMFIEASVVATFTGDTTINKAGPANWASSADQHRLSRLIANHRLIGFGSGTFTANQDYFIKQAQETRQRRVVLTNRPEYYKTFETLQRLEFANLTPDQFVKKYQDLGYTEALLLAGPRVMGAFFEADLIDRFWLTLESLATGDGSNIALGNFLSRFQLVSHRTIGVDKNTLLICYDKTKGPASDS